jgi:ribosome-binding protein aMBF1 (putative translation factor)
MGRRTKGSVALATLGMSQAQVARIVRRSRSAVGHWMTGHTRPNGDERQVMEREFGIPTCWWTEPVRKAVC